MSLNNLKYLREQMGISETDLANKLEMSQQDYEKWENELFPEYTEMLINIARALHVGVKELIEVTVDEPKISIAFPERLKELRKENHLTQVEVAEGLGISQPAYQAWETERKNATKETIKRLSDFFGVSYSYLLGISDNVTIETPIIKTIPQENTFPERLKELRKLANLTQKEMAEALNISQPAYVEWEKGRTQPTPDKFPLIAKVLNTSIDYLLQGAPNENRLVNFQGKTLGERLVFLRKNAGLTQAEVADRLQVGQNSYSNWENGVRTPIYPIIEKLADFFGVTPDSLRGKTDNVVVPKITITPNQSQETEIIDLLNSKLTYNQKTLTSKDKKFFTSVIKSYFGD